MKWILGLALLLAVLVLGCWAFWFEPASYDVKRYRLGPPDWPEALGGLTIAVLADLHVGSPGNDLAKLRRMVRTTNELDADLILLPGDFVIHGVLGGTFVEPEAIAAELAALSAPLGVFAVLGNHDWWLNPRRVREALATAGIPCLDDCGLLVGTGDTAFWLIGISDFWEGPCNFERALSFVANDRPVLSFTHNPDVFPLLSGRICLTLAAHTHGGQVYVPGIGRPVVPSKYGDRYAIGHIVENGRHLFVSPGVGTSILPVRFLVPPEISVITLGAG